jgi:uncharacterized protein YndB with AHSA1/START domain
MLTKKVIIKESIEKVWQALSDKKQMKEWYFDIPDFELKEGAVFNFFEPGGENRFHHQCRMLEIVPCKKLSYTWTYPSYSKGESIVTWNLEYADGITEVTLQHKDIENLADAGPDFATENYHMGWEAFMATLKNYIYGIRRHTYTITINATPEKVWKVLLDDETYRLWTSVFCEGSYFTGDLKPGARIHFLTPDGSGMYSDIVLYSPNTNVLFQHIGEMKNFVEQPIDEATERWTGAFENYYLKIADNRTTIIAEIDLTPDHVNSFNEFFSKGLEKIKELSEL